MSLSWTLLLSSVDGKSNLLPKPTVIGFLCLKKKELQILFLDFERYGGILLGPARFTHIETCAREVCRDFKRKVEVEEHISTLRSLDDILADLRAEFRRSSMTSDVPTVPES